MVQVTVRVGMLQPHHVLPRHAIRRCHKYQTPCSSTMKFPRTLAGVTLPSMAALAPLGSDAAAPCASRDQQKTASSKYSSSYEVADAAFSSIIDHSQPVRVVAERDYAFAHEAPVYLDKLNKVSILMTAWQLSAHSPTCSCSFVLPVLHGVSAIALHCNTFNLPVHVCCMMAAVEGVLTAVVQRQTVCLSWVCPVQQQCIASKHVDHTALSNSDAAHGMHCAQCCSSVHVVAVTGYHGVRRPPLAQLLLCCCWCVQLFFVSNRLGDRDSAHQHIQVR